MKVLVKCPVHLGLILTPQVRPDTATSGICMLLFFGTDLDDGSVQELESLDPQKRELLEARFIGRVNVS